MAQVQLSISNTGGGSSSAAGQITDPELIAKVRDILDALTNTAAETPSNP